MAENTFTISKEDRNFWILNILIQHVAPTAVRIVFDKKIPPNDLAKILNSNVKIIQKLVNKKIIKTHEQDILTRIPGFQLPSMPSSPNKTATSSVDFDITLMICILRCLYFVQPPSSGWNNLPPEGDNSLGANLTRIKVYRNRICHTSKARINDKAFKRMWSSLTQSFSEITCGETDKVVCEIEAFDFEGCDREKLLCKIQSDLHDIKADLQFHRNWKVNTANVLIEWKAELENFYETRGTKEVIEQLNTNTAVMITGNSGMGKTATMKYVSLLFEKKGYEIVMVSSPSDIPLHRFPERKQLFIMDDIIGKYRVDSVAVDLWRKLHDRLRVVFKDNNVKLLSTLRRQLYADMSSISFPTVFNSTIVDLESNHLVLSSYEKKGMLENYLERKKITQHLDEDEKLRICSCHIAYPLLCNLFTSKQEFLKLKSKFFKSASIIFKEELNRLQIENKEVYCVLVMLVIFHLEELQTIFDIDCDIERKLVFDKIIRACEVPDNICRRTLHRYLQSVAGTFVEKKHIFKFQHDKLEETIACHFGSQFPDIMLQYCKLDFIRDRVRLRSLPTDDENILILKQSSFAVFSKRVIDEITKGRFRDILLSQPMQCAKFIEYFAFFIKKNQIDLKDIENASCNEIILPPQQLEASNSSFVYVANIFALLEELQNRKKLFVHWLAAMGCIHLFTLFFKRQEKRYKHYFITELLHLAVSGENIDVIKLLIDEGADLKSFDGFGIPLLCKIASTNRCDIAELLIDKGADVDQADEILGWTSCFVAAWFNEAEMLSFLLSRGCFINEFDLHIKSPLVIALSRNNTQAVSVLLQNGAEIYDSIKIWNYDCDIPINFGFVLEEALNINNPNIIKMLTNNMKRRNQITMSFPVAIRKEDTTRRLLNIFLTEIKSDILRSPIWNDFIDICDAIYENDMPRMRNVFAKGDMIKSFSILRGTSSIKHRKRMLATFDENYLRFCPLHIAAVCDNTKAALVLLQNGADPYQRDARGRTSLHLATSRAMLKLLLSTNDMPKYSKTYSLFNFIKLVLRFFFLFEIVPFLFKSLVTPKNDLKVNVTDSKGNTVIHSMIIRMSDPKKCLDAVETLIHNGADINIRCREGYLPIDLFKMGSLGFEESLITRGEGLLGGPHNKSFVKREKWYLCIWIIIFAVIYILFSFYISDMAFNQKETIPSSNKLDRFYFQSMIYIQIMYLIVIHQCWHGIVSITQAIFVSGVGLTSIRKKLYSDKLFVRFSEKVGLVFLSVLFIALWFNLVHSTYIFFNAYCVIVCISFCIMYIPNPCGNWIRKYRGILILSYKTCLMSCLGIWILYLVLFIKFETPTFTHNIVEKSFNFPALFLFFYIKGHYVLHFCCFVYFSLVSASALHFIPTNIPIQTLYRPFVFFSVFALLDC